MKKIIEFIKFSFVGGLMTILSLVLFSLFIEVFHIEYIVSNIISYTISVVLSYFLNAIVTFKDTSQQKKKINKKLELIKLFKYFIMKLVLLAVDSILLFILVNYLNANVYIVKIALTFIMLVLSFPISKIIIMKGK